MRAWAPRANKATLLTRARLRSAIREHFADGPSAALEVEVPLCQGGPNRDHGVAVGQLAGLQRWLTTSPEHPLKRLVAAGYGPVWCFHPCLRLGELGQLHRPEFTMLEWYRPGWSMDLLIEECVGLIASLLGTSAEYRRIPWRRAMTAVLGNDPDALDVETLRARAQGPAGSSRDDLLDLIFATQVQPGLGYDGTAVVDQWPAAACAQARIVAGDGGQQVAARFEIFVRGVELANGYDECWDGAELRRRFDAHAAANGEPPSHDEAYLAALDHDPGQVSGVALGFDRIVLLATGLSDLGETQAFPWEIA